MVSKHFAIPARAVILLAGWGQNADKAESAAPAEAAAPAAAAPTATAPGAAFDITKIPVSTAPLGVFPYITLPAGYVDGGGKTQDLALFPFRTGTASDLGEGKVYHAGIRPDQARPSPSLSSSAASSAKFWPRAA